MIRNFKKSFCLIFIILFVYIGIRFSNIDKNEKLLNYLASNYFDEEYYLTNYPEISNINISPFEHYIKQGWREGKNPNNVFNTNFYKNLYLLKQNKHNLNPLTDYARAKMLFFKRYTNPEQLKKAQPLPNPKYYLALVAIFQNEARFLKEWIEFYKIVGVEHFYLYNHLSTDNYLEILKPYIDSGIVELRDIKDKPKDLKEWNQIQTSVYTKVTKEVADFVEWLMVVDTDEFLFPVQENKLPNVLKQYDMYPAIGVNWKIFGSNNIEYIPDNKLIIEVLTGATPKPDSCIKSIVKPRYVKYIDHPHHAQLKEGYATVNEKKEYFYGPVLPYESKEILRLNHYWARDLKFFRNTKLSRIHLLGEGIGDVERQQKINQAINSNKEASSLYDDSILKYIPELKEKIK